MKGSVRIGGAVLCGIAIVAMAFWMRPHTPPPEGNVAAVAAPERQYIQTKDSDGDGTKDWEEELSSEQFKTIADPVPATTDGGEYETPDTLTGQFAESFFKDYMQAKMRIGAVGPEEQVIASAVESIEKVTRDTLFTTRDIVVSPEADLSALRAYGNSVAHIIDTHSIDNINETLILKQALDANDPEILTYLKPIREVYEKIIRDTLDLSVPAPLIQEHLNLLNTYEAIHSDIEAMEKAFEDPLLTLARIKRYEDDAAGLLLALANLHEALKAMGIIYAEDEPGAFFHLFEPS